MRIDPEHAKLLASAIATSSGRREMRLDIDYMQQAMDRLSAWECGLLTEALARAGNARRPTRTQRALLALFIHRGGDRE